ncbi:uncharacterized protein LOC129735666 isoform X2 [Falco cherrug]|uniref:uncharacterized protein LOC129735666 isoform X2 n=1 Tax=Falco cherrug TaxID=345164 RepID=UPI002479456C|nr:uncharacterized protein LOC129735666 isoform X2 [Falco cherrug]
MTPAPRPPPAPPCSCRNPGVRAPGRQPAPPSCLHLPPCLPCLHHERPGLALALSTRIPSPARTGLTPQARTFPWHVTATLELCRGHSAPNFPVLSGDARGGAGGDGWEDFFPPFIYLLGGFFLLAGDKGSLCAQPQGSEGAGSAGTRWQCQASRAGGSGWPVSSAHRWLFRLSRALDLNLLLIHGSCSPSAAQLKARRRRRRRRMKAGGGGDDDQGQLRTGGRVVPEGPHPGFGSRASGGGSGGREGGGKNLPRFNLQRRLPAPACCTHQGWGNRPTGLDAPADHFLGEGPWRRKLQRLESFDCDSTAGWGSALPAPGTWGHLAARHRHPASASAALLAPVPPARDAAG